MAFNSLTTGFVKSSEAPFINMEMLNRIIAEEFE